MALIFVANEGHNYHLGNTHCSMTQHPAAKRGLPGDGSSLGALSELQLPSAFRRPASWRCLFSDLEQVTSPLQVSVSPSLKEAKKNISVAFLTGFCLFVFNNLLG